MATINNNKNKSKDGSVAKPKKKSRPSKNQPKAEIPGPPIEPATDSVGAAAPPAGMIFAWEDDPLSVSMRPPIQVRVPTLPTGSLGITIVDAAPPVTLHPIGTSRFRYWTAAEALTRGMEFWRRLMPAASRWSTPDRQLRVHLDLGVDLNAYYRRGTSTLEFFHSTVAGRTVYSGESPNVLCHELGHAVLDAVRPQLFNSMSVETAAFHESFGDISSILCGLQLDSVAQSVIDLTGGRLYSSTFLSRMAEELGWAIRQGRPQSVDPDCLRNAVNAFFYRDPQTLPTSAPASSLSSAPHSFSRVFTAAFYDALAGMIIVDNPNPGVQSLKRVTRDAGQILVDAIINSPITVNYFSQIAAQIIAADRTRFQGKYRDVLKGTFVRHGILSLEAAASVVGQPAPVTAIAGIFDENAENYQDRRDLINIPIPTTDLGFGVASLLCAAPVETGGFPMAAAAALDTGSVTPPPHTEAVMSFVNDLLRLGRIDIEGFGDPETQVSQPNVRKTHVIEETPDGPTIVRITFDCGFD